MKKNIEDDQHIGDILERTLTREGYGTLRAYSGTEATVWDGVSVGFVLSAADFEYLMGFEDTAYEKRFRGPGCGVPGLPGTGNEQPAHHPYP